jgi:hypothetical protein
VHRRALAAVLLAVLSLQRPPLAQGQAVELRLDRLEVTTRGRDVFLRFHLTGALNPELASKIQAGLETAIRYDIRLYRRYELWPDYLVDSRRYGVSATYDPVTREYAVAETMDRRPYRRATTREFAEVARRLTSGEHVLAFRVGEGKPERNLYVRIRARLDSGYLFAFIPVDAKTPWVNSRRFNLFDHDGPAPTPAPR